MKKETNERSTKQQWGNKKVGIEWQNIEEVLNKLQEGSNGLMNYEIIWLVERIFDVRTNWEVASI